MGYYQKVEWTNESPLSLTNMQQMSENTEAVKDIAETVQNKTWELDYKLQELQKRMDQKVTLVHNCMNCGAQLSIEEHKPVIHCKYCGSCYVIGTAQIYSVY